MTIKELLNDIAGILPDKLYLSLRYCMHFHRFPNWDAPVTYNEKLLWLKLYDRDPSYHRMVEKQEVKQYVAERIGEEYAIATLAIWNRAEDIDFDALPEQFVLKCTHDSGSVVVCADSAALDREAAREVMRKGLSVDYYRKYREWPYKDIPRRIIAEEFLTGENGGVPNDYKVMCFDGEPKLIILHRDRYGSHTMDFYDTDWNRTEITRVGQARAAQDAPRPELLEEMLRLSRILAKDIPHLRVDWYITEGKLKLGELTFFNASGFGPFKNTEDDRLLGSWIPIAGKAKHAPNKGDEVVR